jgi:hypothetical protein
MSPRLKALLGWGWLALAAAGGLALVLFSDPLGAAISRAKGLRVSPHFTGGEIAAVHEHGAYKAIVQKPVFEALLWEWPFGFTQVRWEPAAALPPRLREEVDPLGDGTRGFYINLDTVTGEASYEGQPAYVSAPPKAERLKDSWVVRVRMKVPDRAKRKGPRETH